MAGRSGCVIPKDTLFVKPAHYEVLYKLLAGAVIEYEQDPDGLPPLPDGLLDWCEDLRDLAGARPATDEPREPSGWITSSAAAKAFHAHGLPLTARQITNMARARTLTAKRLGRRWLISADAVEAEIDARLFVRKSTEAIGNQQFGESA
jgi:hypothetical protein